MNSQIPGWVWFFTGLVTGLFLALLIYLGRLGPDTGEEIQSPGLASPSTEQESAEEESALPFQFYDIFPSNEVPVVEERMNAESGGAAPSRYYLQTGSFSVEEDADRMRARLLLMGLDAVTRRVTVKGELRHRVLVGPLDDKGDLNHALDVLAEAEIESIALKVPLTSP